MAYFLSVDGLLYMHLLYSHISVEAGFDSPSENQLFRYYVFYPCSWWFYPQRLLEGGTKNIFCPYLVLAMWQRSNISENFISGLQKGIHFIC